MAGNGKYRVFDAQALGSDLGGVAGGVLGNMLAPGIGGVLGGQVGGSIGRALGQGFRSITGFGDYTVHQNSILFPDRVVPTFGDDSIRVRKREFIANVNATTAFTNNFFPVNPGLDEVFPWLSSIANNYEQYMWNGLVFQFVSTSSDAIASTTALGLGQVILASDYNAADAAYVNQPQMLGQMFANSGKPSENIMHAVECKPSEQAQKLFYVRSGDIPEGTDIRLYDMLSFQLATQNMPADYTGMGQLWVSYDVTFCKSVQNNQLGYSINTDKWILNSPDTGGDEQLGATQTLAQFSDLGTTINDNTLVFPSNLASGYYMVSYSVYGGSASVVRPNVTATNCTLIPAFVNNTTAHLTNSGTTSGILTDAIIVRIDEKGATLAYTDGTLPDSATSGDLIITQLNGEIFTG